MHRPRSPKSQQELLERCDAMAGKTLGQLAVNCGVAIPEDLTRNKGWVGSLLELFLGADAGNQAMPDFVDLEIELKTLPLNKQGMPKESTYVCTLPLNQSGIVLWEDCWVRRKLSKVLWVPVEADNSIPLGERYIGQAWLWQPTSAQDAMLKQDWEELMDRMMMGEQFDLTAREGEYLQIRPKAANSRVLAQGSSKSGTLELINPKGFYLRTSFTRQLLENNKA